MIIALFRILVETSHALSACDSNRLLAGLLPLRRSLRIYFDLTTTRVVLIYRERGATMTGFLYSFVIAETIFLRVHRRTRAVGFTRESRVRNASTRQHLYPPFLPYPCRSCNEIYAKKKIYQSLRARKGFVVEDKYFSLPRSHLANPSARCGFIVNVATRTP